MAQMHGPIEFRESMDTNSLNILIGDKIIGFLQPFDFSPRLVLNTPDPIVVLPISLLEEIVLRSRSEIEKRAEKVKAGRIG
jgi:hypothetical protein